MLSLSLIYNKPLSNKNIFHLFSFLSRSMEKYSVKESLVKYISLFEKDKKQLAIMVLDYIENGGRFYDFFNNNVSPVIYSMLKSSEISGNLGTGLKNCLAFSKSINHLKKDVFTSLSYPVFLLFSCLIGFLLFEIIIVPTIFESFSGMGVEASVMFKSLVYISDLLVKHGFLLFILLIFIVIGLCFLVKSSVFKEFPIIKRVYQFIDTYILFFSIKVFLMSKMALYDAVVSLSGSFFLKRSQKDIKYMEIQLFDGKSFQDAIKETSFMSFGVRDFVLDGSEDVSNIALEVEEYLFETMEKVKEVIKKYSEPILLLFVSVVVFIVISAVFAPLSEIINNLNF